MSDNAELARLGHVTRARMTQITNLLNLAPDIQEELLFLTRPEHERESITERHAAAGSGAELAEAAADGVQIVQVLNHTQSAEFFTNGVDRLPLVSTE